MSSSSPLSSDIPRRPSEVSLPLSSTLDECGPSILLNGPNSTSSIAGSTYSPSLSATSFTTEADSPQPYSSAKITFAPLPQVPPELKRRSSITLGVAARKNLLSNQQQQPKPGTVYMTDSDWEQYKQQYEAKNSAQPVDLGEVAKSGARSFWRRVRGSSTSSLSSSSTPLPPPPVVNPRRIQGARRSSAPNLTAPPLDVPQSPPNLGTVEEEEKLSAMHLTNGSPPPQRPSSPPPRSPRVLLSQYTSPTPAYFRRTSEPFHLDRIVQAEIDGDTTPRRIPSPPPRRDSSAEDNESEQVDSNAGLSSPPRSPIRRLGLEAPLASRQKQEAVLGFDDRRYSR